MSRSSIDFTGSGSPGANPEPSGDSASLWNGSSSGDCDCSRRVSRTSGGVAAPSSNRSCSGIGVAEDTGSNPVCASQAIPESEHSSGIPANRQFPKSAVRVKDAGNARAVPTPVPTSGFGLAANHVRRVPRHRLAVARPAPATAPAPPGNNGAAPRDRRAPRRAREPQRPTGPPAQRTPPRGRPRRPPGLLRDDRHRLQISPWWRWATGV
jgi:hypothetical protein